MDKKQAPQSIEEYISDFPGEIRLKLQQLRTIIKETAPQAIEKISYGMPAFAQNGNLVYFAANKKHIGFYPTPSGIKFAEADLKPFKYSKGAIQFPTNRELPEKLIRRIVEFRVMENMNKTRKKKQ
ncbi:iron chaperone [Saccharicrinis sp. FJH54]|uniref:iron chaperone n=1 Tax=Saccharicrinis sp. FJH54 TaxID=3344665 RepID=UPI0035D45482